MVPEEMEEVLLKLAEVPVHKGVAVNCAVGLGNTVTVLLAEAARRIHPQDPALLDFALFGLGEEATRTGRSPKEVLQRLSPSREGPEKARFGE